MKLKSMVLLALSASVLQATPAIAATGLNTSVYHNYSSGSTQAPDYTFTNTSDSFSYYGVSNTSVKDFFGTDAAGQALTDPGSISNMRVDNQGFIDIATAGIYNFSLSADDVAQLFIDGALVANAPNWYTAGSGSLTLAAGFHSFDLNMVGWGTPNGLSLGITGPGSVSYATSTGSVVEAVPEPGTWTMMLLGFGAIGFAMRRQQKVRTNVAFA